MLIKWVFRDLFHNWKASLVFILNLSLGLAGFVTLDAFNVTLKSYLNDNAKKILSADVAVSARRLLSPDELRATRKVVGPQAKESQMFDFFAMLTAGKNSRLVYVKAVDQNYPFYGDMTLESGKVIGAGSEKNIIGQKKVWAYPELKFQLNLKPGDEISLGQAKLRIDDFIAKDSTQTFRSSAIAPKIYISREWLKETGLIQFGSTFAQSYLYELPATSLSDKIKDQLDVEIQDPSVDVETPKTAGEDSGKQLQYLSDYLGLVALIAIFLSSLGAAFVYRLFLSRRLKEVAIYRTLGLQSLQAMAVYVVQAAILGALSLIPTLIAARIFLPFLSYVLSTLIPFNLNPTITASSVFYSFVFAVFISFLITLPFILRLGKLQTSRLFNEEKFSADLRIENPLYFLPAVLSLWALSVGQAHSFRTGSIFFFMLLGVLILFFVSGWFLFKIFDRNKFRTWYVNYGLKAVARLRSSSVAAFVALGLGTLLINVLPQIKTSLESEFYYNANSKTPSLFLFDIQDEQIKPLEEKLAEEKVSLMVKSPMIRARILKINGEEYERANENKETFRTREEEQDARYRNRGVNLSYRDQLGEAEAVIEGQPITERYQPEVGKPAQLSVEAGFRDRMHLKLGDKFLFDVQGVQLEGQIVNFRKVKWNTFQPNFFILVQPGFLDDAPKTFIAAIPKIDTDKKNEIQNSLVQKFPNVSILDVERTIREVLRVGEQMSWSLQLMAILALVVGYVVLFSIIRNQVLQRRWELNMLKILGSSFADVRAYLLVESVTISLMASFLGILLSLAVSFGLTFWVFKTGFAPDFTVPLISIVLVVLLSVIISLFAAQGILKEKPLVILRENS